MPLINQSFEYLPDIDTEISPTEHASILASLSKDTPSTLHPSLPPIRPLKFSDLIQDSHAHISKGDGEQRKSAGGIDTSRYNTLTAPSSNETSEWRTTLRSAYTSHTYLSLRALTLSLLETHGKNAWLIANADLEVELAVLEAELADMQRQVAETDRQRANARAEAKGEFEVLQETWRRGVGRALETEIAAEELRRAVLEKRREGAVESGAVASA